MVQFNRTKFDELGENITRENMHIKEVLKSEESGGEDQSRMSGLLQMYLNMINNSKTI